MNIKPILFSPAMVRALLDGTKTQTRRVMKPQPCNVDDAGRWYRMPGGGESLNCHNLPYAPEDRLWVREAWRTEIGCNHMPPRDLCPGGVGIGYEVEGLDHTWGRYRPPMFMPRWASRLTLTVTDVRVQRVQDISEDDAVAEGIAPSATVPFHYHRHCGQLTRYPVDAFHELWDALNEARGFGWVANPWVVATTFTLEKRNVDQ